MALNLKSLVGKLNPTTRNTLEGAAGLCLSRTHYDVEIEHWLFKLLEKENDATLIVRHFGLDKARIMVELARYLDTLKSGNARTPALSQSLIRLIKEAWVLASVEYGATEIRSGNLLLAAVSDPELARIVQESSRELARIEPETLRSKFAEILKTSFEAGAPPSSPLQAVTPAAVTPASGPAVFICYRREDSQSYADALYDRVCVSVKGVKAFRDTDTLKGGMVFPDEIERAVAGCDVLIPVIGKKWLELRDNRGNRRLDNEQDWVRVELGAAIRQKKLIIPCLVGGARMPMAEELPIDLAGLPLRNAVKVSLPRFRYDTQTLIEVLNDLKSAP